MYLENDVFILHSTESVGECDYLLKTEENIEKIAEWFGFVSFPNELKIHIYIEKPEIFKIIKEKYRLSIPSSSIAFTVEVNKIYITMYECLSHLMTQIDYAKLIIHECTHVLQMYYCKIDPSKYIWLYESMACFIAKQYSTCELPLNICWSKFVNDFYNIDGCYSLAYKYGSKMFQYYSDKEILKLLKNPNNYIDEFKKIYDLLGIRSIILSV